MPEPLAVVVLVLTAGVLALLLPFAAHRTRLLLAAIRRQRPSGPEAWAGELPGVTVQIPLFNEMHVVERVVDAACRLRYPREKLEIQILDDSTDGTRERAAARVRWWAARGVRVRHLHRSRRTGYKAGALAGGLRMAEGEFLLVLDADFLPPGDLIHRLLPPFLDPAVGMVQARWDHLNEEQNRLTRAQALLLDGHFFLEHAGREALGCFFNFNGTAGMWRRSCLVDAGGWSADTLTEDLDVSYRAQMRGWRFVFLEEVGVPGELPASAAAFRLQQGRWAQGGVQTARKILPRLLPGPWPLRVKAEATIHLLGHLAHPLTLLLGLLLYPAAAARRALGLEALLPLDLAVFAAATAPFLVFYTVAGRRRRRSWRRLLPDVVTTLVVGVGLSAPVSRAVLRGLQGRRDPFRRTPKAGGARRTPYRVRPGWTDVLGELLPGGVMLVWMAAAVQGGYYASLPFLALFAAGYLGLGVAGLRERIRGSRGRGIGTSTAAELQEEEGEGSAPYQEPQAGRVGPVPGLPVGTQAGVGQEYEAA